MYKHERREIGENCGGALTHPEEEMEDLDTFDGETPERTPETQDRKWYMHVLFCWVEDDIVNFGSPQADSEFLQPRAVGVDHGECTWH